MDLLESSLNRSNGLINSAYETAVRHKAAGLLSLSPSSGLAQLDNFRSDAASKERYALFRGWLYSAVNALCMEAAGQPVNIAEIKGTSNLSGVMTKSLREMKAPKQEYEILLDHPLLDKLETPNPIQGRWQFVYSFIANLCLTGWGYIIAGEGEEGELEIYSLPTNWVKPDHTDGPFTKFRIINPRDPTANLDQEPLTRENVAFAHLPNPADPLSALAPAQSQLVAINIDDHIQACQSQFFKNGIFPSVIVTVGKDPHPDVPGGLRPRLSGAQRRQVTGAIRKVMGGIANYGNPAIIDGMIESIERLSATQNEIGWEKSEQTVRTRILSAFGVHPYILGEPVSVGGYAQVANIEKRFYKRVNTLLDMLGNIMTHFAKTLTVESPEKAPKKKAPRKLVIWWEECKASDPSLQWSNLNAARGRGDVSRNEIRVELGLPPDETGGERTKNFTAPDISAIAQVQGLVGQGQIEPEQAALIYELAFDLSPEDAKKLAGKKPEAPPPAPEAAPNGALPINGKKPPQSPEEVLEEATDKLDEASKALIAPVKAPFEEIIAGILDFSQKMAENQPRDSHGRFATTSGTGSTAQGDKPEAKVESKPPSPFEKKSKAEVIFDDAQKASVVQQAGDHYVETHRDENLESGEEAVVDRLTQSFNKEFDEKYTLTDTVYPIQVSTYTKPYQDIGKGNELLRQWSDDHNIHHTYLDDMISEARVEGYTPQEVADKLATEHGISERDKDLTSYRESLRDRLLEEHSSPNVSEDHEGPYGISAVEYDRAINEEAREMTRRDWLAMPASDREDLIQEYKAQKGYTDDETSEVQSKLENLLGDGSEEFLATLSGAPDDSKVTIKEEYGGDFEIETFGPRLRTTIHIKSDENTGESYIYLDGIWGQPDANGKRSGKGLVLETLPAQVTAARQAGINSIRCHAARGRSMNGYITWPKAGFDADLGELEGDYPSVVEDARNEYPDADLYSVQDILAQPGGEKWWADNGVDLYHATFDLTDGSRSMQVLEAYVERKMRENSRKMWSKAAKNKRTYDESDILAVPNWVHNSEMYKQGFINFLTNPELLPEDERILDEINAELAAKKVLDKRLKYAPGQPRDDHGRFSTHGGVGGDRADTGADSGGVAAPAKRTAYSQLTRASFDKEAGEIGKNGEPSGQWKYADGKPVPQKVIDNCEKKPPPTWTEVAISKDHKAKLLVKGKDKKGRWQSVYSKTHRADKNVKKFVVTNEIRSRDADITSKLTKDLTSRDLDTRENAAVLTLIKHTGMRVSSDTETNADFKSYGASTLEARHVNVGDNGVVTLKFTGAKKHGKELDSHEVEVEISAKALGISQQEAASLTKMLKGRKKAADGPYGRLFDTTYQRVNKYTKSIDTKFKPKDFRSAKATSLAVDLMKRRKAPTTQDGYEKAVMEVADEVAKVLTNSGAECIKSYIDPVVFSKWRVS